MTADDDIRAQGRDYENDTGTPRWSLTPTEAARLEVELDAEPRVIPELRALIDAYCNGGSCWLKPGHGGECELGGRGHAGRGA